MTEQKLMPMRTALTVFLALAFGLSWSCSAVYYRFLGTSPVGDVLMPLLYMWGPGIAALVVARLVLRQPWAWFGPIIRFNRYLLVAMLIPVAMVVAYTLLSAAAPGVSLNLDTPSLSAAVLANVPAEHQERVLAQIAPLADHLLWILLAQVLIGGLVTGLTVTSIAALGEELGWRGFLHQLLAPWGFWQRSLFVGLIWGVWHAPLMLRGHNLSDHPGWSVLLMLAYCVLWSPIFEYVRMRSGYLWSAVIMHGVLNGVSSGAVLFVHGGSSLWRGPIGLSALIVLAIGWAMLWWLRRTESGSARAQ